MSASAGGGLRAVMEHAAAAARRDGRAHFVALRARAQQRDPLACFDAARDEERFYWERPAERIALAASGALHAIETDGAGRFDEAAARGRELFARIHVAGDPAPAATGPLLVGGFAFDDRGPRSAAWRGFPAGRLVLPEQLLLQTPAGAWCTLARRVHPDEDLAAACEELDARMAGARSSAADATAASRLARQPGANRAPCFRASADAPHSDYCGRVAEALDALAAGDFEKVVVARSVRLESAEAFDPGAILDALRRTDPRCASFAVARGSATFLGVTPERLARVRDGRVATAALAGSAPRGRSPERDARLARALVESKKEQSEHAIVVRALREALAPRCRELEVPEAPRLLRLEGIQHLETPIEGRLADDLSVLEVARLVHPTAAIAGAPRGAALAWLARNERLDRGWYGGPVGFVDAEGGGELAVALRSALLREGSALLFAGAGVVAGSRPEAELAETRLKLRALLTPLLEI